MSHPVMGPLRAKGNDLRVFCETPGCRDMVLIPLHRVVHWPDSFTIFDMKDNLRCTRCGCTNPTIHEDTKSPLPFITHPERNAQATKSRTSD